MGKMNRLQKKRAAAAAAAAEAQAQAQAAAAQAEAEEVEAARVKARVVAEGVISLNKIGEIIDICFELLPEDIGNMLTEEISNQAISSAFMLKLSSTPIPFVIINEYELDNIFGRRNKRLIEIDKFIKLINKRINENLYTNALIEIIYFLIKSSLDDFKQPLFFKKLSFIGTLLLDMGAIEPALKLYKVEKRIFSNSNALSDLISCSIKKGDLNSANQLVKKLIEQEPFHPSIQCSQTEIKHLEQRHYLQSTSSIDFSEINNLSGIAFENLLIDKFLELGFTVKPTPKTGDFGADIVVENSEGSVIIIQCKRFKSKVNLKAVQEVVGALGHYSGDIGIVITNNLFLNSAITLAKSHDIELWNGDNLVSLLAGDLSFSNSIGEP